MELTNWKTCLLIGFDCESNINRGATENSRVEPTNVEIQYMMIIESLRCFINSAGCACNHNDQECLSDASGVTKPFPKPLTIKRRRKKILLNKQFMMPKIFYTTGGISSLHVTPAAVRCLAPPVEQPWVDPCCRNESCTAWNLQDPGKRWRVGRFATPHFCSSHEGTVGV